MQMLLDKLAVVWSAAFPAKTLILEKAVEPQKAQKAQNINRLLYQITSPNG
jgi:hypothetical protein